MNSKLKLYHKGLFFLSVFVVLELVFVGWLFYLLHSAEQEAQNYERSMHITKCANDLLKQYTDGAGALAFYAATGSSSYKSKYEATVAGIPAAKKELHDSIKDDPNGLAEVQELTNLLDQAGNALIAYKKEVDEQRGDLLQLRRKALPTIKRAMEALKVLLEKEAVRAEKAYPKSSKDMRERMVLVICIALAVHIAVAIFVLRYFITTITRRIDILTDNSMRLAMGKPLNPLLTGQDEIAFLDGRFHTMAEVLEEASAKERQATEAIKESEEQIRALVDHMPVGLIAIEKTGTIVSINPRTEMIFGYQRLELEGKSIQMLFADTEDEDPKTFMQTIYQKAFRKTSEIKAKRKSGEEFPSDIAINEIQTKKGMQLLVNVQDVTDRHEAERLKREFVAMVSHDLRTPLTSLLGSLSLLSAGALGELPSEAHDVVGTAETEVERLMRLINDLLDVAKIEAGKMEMTFDTTSLKSVISRSIDSVKTFAENHNVSLVASATDVSVLADSDRLMQVLINLLSNAVKFSPPESRVEVSVVEEPGWVQVQVRDYGRGVPPQFREAIFERFQQVETDDATKKGGTGLGLPICKTIIEQHGGTIGVNGDVEPGSIFWFRLRELRK